MNVKLLLTQLTLCAGLTALTGCNKEQSAQETQPVKTPEPVASGATQGLDQVKNTAAEATNKVAAEVKVSQDKAQGLIDKAKSLFDQNKPQEALASLTQLGGLPLTDEQKQTVESLKAKIQAALAKATTGDAASGLRNALGTK